MKKIFILFSILTLTLNVQAQEPNDCIDAITVCGNGVFRSNATDEGSIQEISYCGGLEHNSIWLKIDIVQTGTLGFDLIPDDPDITVDYDFWVFAPNSSCSNLGTPIRCATTNPELAGLSNNQTGINGSTTLTGTGPGANGNGYVFWLLVTAGESYYIAIDRPVGDGGFEIQWTGTAVTGTGAFPEAPVANDIDDVVTCSTTPDVGIFNLNDLKSSVNSDPGNYIEFYETLADATDGINPLADPISNPLGIYATTTSPQQIYAKVVSPGTQCYSLTDFNLVVEPVPDASATASPASICEGETITYTFTGSPDTTVHYSVDSGPPESIELEASGDAILELTASANTTLQLLDVQILSPSGSVTCSTSLSQSISTSVTPGTVPNFIAVNPICVGDSLSSLPTTSTEGITGVWSPALDNTTTTTYTFTPDPGQCAVSQTMEIVVSPGGIPTFNPVAAICNGDTLAPLPTASIEGITGIWSPALDNTTTTTYTFTPDPGQCASTQNMEIIVRPIIIPVFTQVDPICSGEVLVPLPTTSNNGVAGIWSPTVDNTVTTIYTFTPNGGQCADVQTMEVVVNPIITPEFTQVPPVCYGESLPPLLTTSNNGVDGTWSPALDTTVTTTYTFTPAAGQCAVTQTMEIIVNPLPIIVVDNWIACSTSGDGLYAFDLTSQISEILGSSQDPADFDVSFYEDASLNTIIASNPYTNTTPYNQIIYVAITNNLSLCTSTFPFKLTVENEAVANQPNPVIACDYDGENDGFFAFDLTILNNEILNGQDAAIYLITYHETRDGANTGFDPIPNPESFINTTAYNQTVYIRVTNINSPDICFATTSFDYQVSPILKPVITSENGFNTICVDYGTGTLQNELTMLSDLQGTNYDYTWYLDGVEIVGAKEDHYIINTAAPGLYSLAIREVLTVANCTSEISESFEVIQSGQAEFVNVTQTGAFQSNPSITITVNGYGDYWFQLDDGPILDNDGLFENVSGGFHDVTIYDRKTETPSCDPPLVVEDIRIIDYPKVFTPNDDGYNETWNIFALSDQSNAEIHIYDRYGKFLQHIKPAGQGWNGTYKGERLPSNDYWFVLTYEELGQPKEFRSHFALKR